MDEACSEGAVIANVANIATQMILAYFNSCSTCLGKNSLQIESARKLQLKCECNDSGYVISD